MTEQISDKGFFVFMFQNWRLFLLLWLLVTVGLVLLYIGGAASPNKCSEAPDGGVLVYTPGPYGSYACDPPGKPRGPHRGSGL